MRRSGAVTFVIRPGNPLFGIVNDCGIGQSDFMWSVRSNRNIKRVYAQIWETNELLVSFDGCGIYRNWRREPQWKTTTGWYHVDQNPVTKPDRCCIQGFVSLTDQNEMTGGLIVFPHTHLRFQELVDLARRTKDFVAIPSMHSILDGGRAVGRFIQCRAGDLVLWDSRLVHCNSPAFVDGEGPTRPSDDLLRIVAYVSMSPTTMIRNYTLGQFQKQRKLIAQNNCTLTHWSTDLTESSKFAKHDAPEHVPHRSCSVLGTGMHLPRKSLEKLDAYQRALVIGVSYDEE